MTKRGSSFDSKKMNGVIKVFSNIVEKEINKKLKKINEILKTLSEKRNSFIFAILYSNFVPIQREHVHEIYNLFRDTLNKEISKGSNTIDLIIHTTGGDADAAFHIGYIIQNCVKEVEKNKNQKYYRKNGSNLG